MIEFFSQLTKIDTRICMKQEKLFSWILPKQDTQLLSPVRNILLLWKDIYLEDLSWYFLQAQIFIQLTYQLTLYFLLQGRYKVQRRVFSDETSKFEWQDVLEVLRRMKVELQTFEGSKMERARMLHNYTILLMYATVAPVSLKHKIFAGIFPKGKSLQK